MVRRINPDKYHIRTYMHGGTSATTDACHEHARRPLLLVSFSRLRGLGIQTTLGRWNTIYVAMDEPPRVLEYLVCCIPDAG
jgi:hypothetical protein